MSALNKLEEADVHSLVDTLKRNRRTILVFAGAFTAVGMLVNMVMPPVYRATARLEIRRPPDRSPLTGQSFSSPGFQSENVSMYTAAERIKDRLLLSLVAGEFAPQGWIQTLPTDVARPQGGLSRL